MILAKPGTLAQVARNLVMRHTRCRLLGCPPDWLEAIALGWLRPRCQHCRRTID